MKNLYLLFCLIVVFGCNTSTITSDSKNNATKKDSASTTQSAAQQTEEDKTAMLNQSITMKVYDKGFSKIGAKEFTRLDISITNKSDQVITAVKGRFVVDNLFGDHLKNYNLKFDDADIRPGKTIKITRFWDYDKTAKEDVKIISTPLSKLKIAYQPEIVLYADGSSLH